MKIFPFLLLFFFTASAAQSQNIDSILLQYQNTPSQDSNKVLLLMKLSRLSRNEAPEKAKEYSRLAIETAKNQMDMKLLLRALLAGSGAHMHMGDYIAAGKIIEEGLFHARKSKLPQFEVRLLSNYGGVYLMLEDNERAADYFFQALQKAEAEGMHQQVEEITQNLCNVYLDLEEFEKVRDLSQKSLAWFREDRSGLMFYSSYFNLARAMIGLKDWPSAERYLDSAANVLSVSALPKMHLVNLAMDKNKMYLERGVPEKGLEVLMTCFSDSLLAQILPATKALYYNALGVCYHRMGNFRKSIEFQRMALETQESANFYNTNNLGYLENLADSYAGIGNFEQAYAFLAKRDILNDSLNTQSKLRTTKLTIFKREMESKERALLAENQQLAEKNKMYLFFLGIGVLLAFVGGGIFYFSRKVVKAQKEVLFEKRLKESLETQLAIREEELKKAFEVIQNARERELAALSLLNQQHSDTLVSIEKILVKAMDDKQSIDRISAKQIHQQITNTINNSDDWSQTMLHFEKSNADFFKRLHELNANLTSNDLRHCVYLRLGLARKEVAGILNCSDDAVKLARNRLKKKLGLAPDDSLQDFIIKL